MTLFEGSTNPSDVGYELLMPVGDLLHDEALRKAVGQTIDAEVVKRGEWYGLDNWTAEEVAEFVLEAAADHIVSAERALRKAKEATDAR